MPTGHRRLLRHPVEARSRAKWNLVASTLASAVIGLAMVGTALLWLLSPTPPLAERDATDPYTVEELAQYDGRDGHDCLVAVDGDVYLIKGFALWSMGRHTPSGGRARCGLDLTDVIDESPHGKSKLQLLKKVGVLERADTESG